MSLSVSSKPSFGAKRLEQFDRISRRIFENDLFAANPSDDGVPKVSSHLAKRFDHPLKVSYFNREAIPPARLLLGAIGHRLATTACGVRCTQDKPKVAPRQHRKGRCRVHFKLEIEPLGVERNCGIHVVDDVADLNRCHLSSSI